MKELFLPERPGGPLEARRDSFEETETYCRERVSFNAAYRGERVSAVLFTPKGWAKPWQVVCLFPGMGATTRTSSEGDDLEQLWHVEKIVGMGRAVMYPLYKGTYERGDGREAVEWPEPTARERLTQSVLDLSRSIDYLESRKDIDLEALSYYGVSYGAELGVYCLAIEERLRAGVLVAGGLTNLELTGPFRPELFAERVHVPVLMLNGRFDFIFPIKEAQESLYRGLGTTRKAHRVFESTHSVPADELVEETRRWLDKYLGPAGGREQ